MDFSPIAEDAVVGGPDWFLSSAAATTVWRETAAGGFALIAFSSKPYIHIFRFGAQHGLDNVEHTLSYVGQLQGHHDRISCISFCDFSVSSPTQITSLFSCGFDGLVRQWTYVDQDWILDRELNIRELNDSLLPTSLHCIYHQHLTVTLIGTNKGTLIVWITSGQSREPVCLSKKFESEAVITCSWEAYSGAAGSIRAAVGYKKGIVGIYMYNASCVTSGSSLTQLSRFYAHEKDICHIVWRPYNFRNEGVPDNSAELLTTGRDQFVKLWTVTNSWCSASLKVPGSARQVAKGKERSANVKDNSVGLPWISGCWFPSETQSSNLKIIVSGLRGELYSWSGSEKQPVRIQLGAQAHSMLIFAITPIVCSPGFFVTIGQDRQVLIWQRKGTDDELSYVYRIPTIAAGVSALAQSDHGHGPLAVGTADGAILLWRRNRPVMDISGPKTKDNFITFWPRGVNGSNITALAWHPSPRNESLLAYGTEAGCVDLIDTAKVSKNTQKSKSQPYVFGSTVYRVSWGPCLFVDPRGKEITNGSDSTASVNEEMVTETTESLDILEETESKSSTPNRFSFYVYSACKGKIFCHIGFQRPPLDVTLLFPIPFGVDQEDWKSDKRSDVSFVFLDKARSTEDKAATSVDIICECFTCLVAVGFRSGHVDVYGCVKQNHSSEVAKLHPICRIKNHTKGINCLAWSPFYYRLAIGSNESFITVADLSDVLRKATDFDVSCFTQLSTCLARLEGHCNRITCLDWSPHDPNLLLSASFDGTANVWKVTGDVSGSLGNFRAHRLRLFACIWSRHEVDLAFSGGELCHLFGWRPSRLLHKEPPNCRRYRPPPIKHPQNDFSAAENSSIMKAKLDAVSLPESSVDVDGCSSVDAKQSVDVKESTKMQSSDQPLKQSTTKKSSSVSEKRKRPSLFPHFLHRTTVEHSSVDLSFYPPVRLGSRFVQVLKVLDWIRNKVCLTEPDHDLLFLLPENSATRTSLVQFLNHEAAHHLATYRSTQRPNGLAHLDAYCIVQLWLGRASLAASMLCSESHLPFWLLWAVQLSLSTAPSVSALQFGVDLLDAKVKEMGLNNPDILVAATLLVCAGRSREAVDYLLSHDRVKEALILARIRLCPTDAEPIVRKCLNRIMERRLVGEITFIGSIRALGEGNWTEAHTLIRQCAITSVSRPGTEVELLASSWVELSILLGSSDSAAVTKAFVRLACSCLVVGFNLLPEQRLPYFEKWSTISPSNSDECGVTCFAFLLRVGEYFSAILEGSVNYASVDDWLVSDADVLLVLRALRNSAHDRQPSGLWAVCVVHAVLDFAICQLFFTDSDDEKQSADDYIRFGTSLRRCMNINSKDTLQLIGGLLLNANRAVPKDLRLIDQLSTELSSTAGSPSEPVSVA
ncbi:Gem associated protein 5 [Paragonimus heterotremus]|uniref:Gem associated protein 5 n=1 Tax=Paragonimus heterotremus TaxID=100268 RepID=A0A8J4WPX2_9TREM|nr:Gem associated protein 5 [Paragonimus heterotremus]